MTRNVSTTSIDELRSLLGGRAILPGESGYDERRRGFYGGFDRHPAAIVQAATDEDVRTAVVFAREHGFELAVRSGGHSIGGHSTTEGGILLDLGGMRAIEIDPADRSAWAEPGLTAGEYTRAVLEHGLVTGFGDTASVGIAGLTLGGGVGYLSRKLGLTIDSLLAADVVTADGQLRRVDDQNYPELFWAIRGGGGNFGIVTRFKLRLQELGQVVGGLLVLPGRPETLAGLVAAAASASDDLSIIANVLCPAPPLPFLPPEHHGGKVILANAIFAGPPEQAAAAFGPFRALGPIADLLRPMSYLEIFPPDDPSYRPVAVSRSFFMDSLDVAAAARILDAMDRSDAPMRACQVRVLGGAVSRVPGDATAYAFRNRPIMVNVASICGPEGVTPDANRMGRGPDRFPARIRPLRVRELHRRRGPGSRA